MATRRGQLRAEAIGDEFIIRRCFGSALRSFSRLSPSMFGRMTYHGICARIEVLPFREAPQPRSSAEASPSDKASSASISGGAGMA
ncbi:hypothetical protein MHY1_01203 [Methylovirgula sp. HY1]|nr:hypothetical protein MHY1_01203 [Methylovirgula sp. HY1]